MWKCRVSVDRESEYGAYSSVFDNILGYLIGNKRSTRNYVDLIEENRVLFMEASERSVNEIVEPRELMFLLNHLDGADRLYWTPRPYRRSGLVHKEFLFLFPDNTTVVCAFCGFKTSSPVEIWQQVTPRGNVTRSSAFDTTASSGSSQQAEVNNLLLSALLGHNNTNSNNTNRSLAVNLNNTPPAPLQQQQAATGQGAPQEFVGVDEVDNTEGPASVANNENIEPNAVSATPSGAVGGPSGAQTTPSGSDPSTRRQDEAAQPQRDAGEPAPPLRFHFYNCPLLWLEKNCHWSTKYSMYHIHEPSRFGNALHVLQRRRQPGFMTTEMEWIEYVQLTSNTSVMGACEDTLAKCYRKLAQMKLDNVDRCSGDIAAGFRRLPLYAVHYDCTDKKKRDSVCQPRCCRPLAYILEHTPFLGSPFRYDRRTVDNGLQWKRYVQLGQSMTVSEEEALAERINREKSAELAREAREAKNFLAHILSGSPDDNKVDSTRFANRRFTYVIDVETAWRAFVMHGFCVQLIREPKVIEGEYDLKITGDFSSRSDTGGYTVHQRVAVPVTTVFCIYCSLGFEGRLCDPNVVTTLYSPRERESVADYLLSRSTCRIEEKDNGSDDGWTWWKRNPGPYGHMALSPEDVIRRPNKADANNSSRKRKLQHNSDEEKVAVWLSASLNISHSTTCIYRLKGRNWPVENCPVCLVEDTHTQEALFTCGHTVCNTCINDVRITHCPLCKEGTRKRRLKMHTQRVYEL